MFFTWIDKFWSNDYYCIWEFRGTCYIYTLGVFFYSKICGIKSGHSENSTNKIISTASNHERGHFLFPFCLQGEVEEWQMGSITACVFLFPVITCSTNLSYLVKQYVLWYLSLMCVSWLLEDPPLLLITLLFWWW